MAPVAAYTTKNFVRSFSGLQRTNGVFKVIVTITINIIIIMIPLLHIE